MEKVGLVTGRVLGASVVFGEGWFWLMERWVQGLWSTASSAMAQGFLVLFFFLRLHLQHVEVPRLGIESKLQLLACTTATARRYRSHVCDLRHSSRQCWILNPVSEARDRTCILRDTSRVLNPQWKLCGPSIFRLTQVGKGDITCAS